VNFLGEASTLGPKSGGVGPLARGGRYTPTALASCPPMGRPSVLARHGLGCGSDPVLPYAL
jgi:hypothetical protein